MKRSSPIVRALRPVRLVAVGLCALLAGAAAEASQTCREWWHDHEEWKAQVIGLYLSDASQREVDEAMFELVQLEAYLTACAGPLPAQRARLVSHRTLGRPVDEFAAAVAEGVLEQSGFDLSLDDVLLAGERRPSALAAPPSRGARE